MTRIGFRMAPVLSALVLLAATGSASAVPAPSPEVPAPPPAGGLACILTDVPAGLCG